MTKRRTRAEQVEQVRIDLLAAARREFLAAGYHGATLDRIAAAAGYTKGVVYSRFASKADLFLALLEERIDARAQQNRERATGVSGPEGLAAHAGRWADLQQADLPWSLLVLEFRVHATRDPELAGRYAALHRRTLDGITEVLEGFVPTTSDGLAPREVAQAIFAAGTGATLEQAVDPSALPHAVIARMVLGLVPAEVGR